MNEASSSDPPLIGSGASTPTPTHGYFRRNTSEGNHELPLNEKSSVQKESLHQSDNRNVRYTPKGNDASVEKPSKPNGASGNLNTKSERLANAASTQDERSGSILEAKDGEEQNNKPKRTLMEHIRRSAYLVITHSWLNVLLVFVPVGIAVSQIDGIHGGVVFAMNAIAIIPLAGLLAFATESVAVKMGDALGALLNVTFGNAVELIIFIIALVKDEIRIVQASLLGSILANLLLILGMGFFLGGLRYREQVYNSTVTQMSACLLSLSVISLVLPTAFHASFKDDRLADQESLKISRGTSVILLLVYIIYLVFQLKSHAYMYESTPQHIVDAESTPGPAAGWLESSDSDSSSSSSSSDSDDSDHSRDTMRKKMKKVLRGGRRRKSSFASVDTDGTGTRASSFTTMSPQEEGISEASSSRPKFPRVPSLEGSEEAVEEEKYRKYRKYSRHRRHKHKKNKRKNKEEENIQPTTNDQSEAGEGEPRRVDFAVQHQNEDGTEPTTPSRRPFPALRGMSVKNLAPPVFAQKSEPIGSTTPAGPVPRVRYGIRRTNSLPDRLNAQNQFRPPGGMFPSSIPMVALNSGLDTTKKDDEEEHLTKAASVILLLLSTALVAVCAEFLVDSIEEVVKTSSVREIFIGLIILPIVGNAAEHVTAITVAMKNKMDLAIGVAVGSSIQIALFITPLVVILGWCMDRNMTLYFTLFETVCLFVSAFIVNFLVLDGRSNYLEGALLCAVYVIIAVVAYFYPQPDDASSWGV